MATGGHNSRRKQATINSQLSSSRDWNYSTNPREAETWNHVKLHMPNNLMMQDWDPYKDVHVRSVNNNGLCVPNKNDAHLQREKVSDKEENHALDAFGMTNGKLLPLPKSAPFPRSKFTASSSSSHSANMNGARQKSPKHKEEGAGDMTRNKSDSSATNKKSRIADDSKLVARNFYHNTDLLANVKENTGKTLNANQVLTCLSQIQDSMKQVTMTIDTLKKADAPKTEKRIQKLEKVLGDLKYSERQMVEFLNKDLQPENEMLTDGGRPDETSEDSSAEDDDQNDLMRLLLNAETKRDEEPNQIQRSNALSKQLELLNKMKECEEKLKMWQNHQASLTQLQQKAENRLASSRACHNQLILNSEGENDVYPVDVQVAAASQVQDDLDCLQERLNTLKDMYDNRQRAESLSKSQDKSSVNEECNENQAERDRQELQNKLNDLQKKKRCMDNLLEELTTIRAMHSQQLMKNESDVEKYNEGLGTTEAASSTLRDAQDLLVSLDTTDKIEKLKEMKNRLHQLQEMVANYQPEVALANEESDADTTFNSHPKPIHNRATTPTSEHTRKENMQRKVQLQKKVNEYMGHTASYQPNNYGNDRDATDKQDGSLNNDRLSLEEDGTVQEKLNKLQSARAKISTLEKLVAAINDSQLPEDLSVADAQQLLDEVDNESFLMHHFDQIENTSHNNKGTMLLRDERDVPASNDEMQNKIDKRKNKMNRRLDDKRAQFENLIEEGNRLMQQQQELARLKRQISDNNKAEAAMAASNHSSLSPSRTELSSSGSKNRTQQEPSNKSNQHKVMPKNDVLSQQSCNKNSLQNVHSQKVLQEDIQDADSDFAFSNQEFWSEMRQRLILREELHQKRRELEELMRKDHGKSNSRNQDNMSDNISYSNKSEGLGMSFVGTEGTTAATWGGSTQGNPEEDQEDQNDTQEEVEEADENEEYYSSEGMGPVSEALPTNQGTKVYSPVSEYRNADQCRRQQSMKMHAASNNTTKPTIPKIVSDFKDMRNIWNKSDSHSGNQGWSHQLEEHPPARSMPQEIIEERREPEVSSAPNPERTNAFLNQHVVYLQQQWEQMNAIRQSIMREECNLNSLFRQQSNLNVSTGISNCSPVGDVLRPHIPEMCQQYSQQLQHQHVLMNLNHCYHMLYLQTLEIQQIQQQLQQLLRLNSPNYNCSLEDTVLPAPSNTPRPTEGPEARMMAPPTLSSSCTNTHFPRSTYGPCSSVGHSVVTSRSYPNSLTNQQMSQPETLNNQVAPGMRANNYWDNFRSYSRQNLLSTAPCNKLNGVPDSSALNNPFAGAPAGSIMQNHTVLSHEGAAASVAGIAPITETLQHEHIGRRHAEQGDQESIPSLQVPKLDLDNLLNKVKDKKVRVNQDLHKNVAETFADNTANSGAAARIDGYKPGLSSGISGTAYLFNTSCSSSAVSLGSSARELPCSREGIAGDSHMSNIESEDICDRSMFESMRDSIYAEVAALISQNENRPQFLIQLFTELQMLTSDHLRHNALLILHDLVTRAMAQVTPPGIRRQARPTHMLWNENAVNVPSEQTASESFITSDDEEMRTHMFKVSKSFPRTESSSSKRLLEKVEPRCDLANENDMMQVRGSFLESASSEFQHTGDDGMSETFSPIGKSKESNQQKKKLMSVSKINPNHSTSVNRPTLSKLTSDSSSELGCQISTSDIPGADLDTSQLDDQIQGLMLRVIPFLKAHLDELCSTNILSYVCQLTLSLVLQLDEAKTLNQFFKKQLRGTLQDTLMKYLGKRLRDCGEDLLVDMSEVLFNELVFLRLVQNMDPNNSLATKSKHFQGMTQTPTSSTSNGSSPKNKSSMSENRNKNKESFLSQASTSSQAMDLEATDIDTLQRTDDEDLGMLRDDALAATCDIFDNEDASRASSMSSVKVVSIPPEAADEQQRPTPNRLLPTDEIVPLPSRSTTPLHCDSQELAMPGEADPETEAEGLEDNQDLAEADQSQMQSILETADTSSSVECQMDSVSLCSEELIRAEATEDDQAQRSDVGSRNDQGATAGIVGAEGMTEQGLDEIPIKLCSLVEGEMFVCRQVEELHNSIVDEILRDSVEAELAENGIPLRTPNFQ